MVISYSIKELNAIGEMVILKECISRLPTEQISRQPSPPIVTTTVRYQPATSTVKSASDFLNDFAQFQQQLGQSVQINRDQNQNNWQSQYREPPLTNSVAEFFKKAQQNFNPPTTIDPTKVRRLSDVEAELIGNRSDSSY